MKASPCLLLVLLSGLSLAAPEDPAPVPEDPRAPLSVQIDFGDNHAVKPGKARHGFGRVGIDPQKQVEITVRYAAAMAGTQVVAEALDGGEINFHGKTLVIDQEGVLSFRFKARGLVGDARIALSDGESVSLVRFWVLDKEHPQRNPKLQVGN